MTMETTSDLAAWGPNSSVRYAKDSKARMHAAEFLKTVAPAKDARRLRHWFQVMANDGRIQNPQAFKHERGPMFAFKAFECRVPCFRTGSAWFLTHGFLKKKARWPETEFQRAERIMAEHLARKGQ